MRKVILNKCFGGYVLSPLFIAEYLDRIGAPNVTFHKTVYADDGERYEIPITRDEFVEGSGFRYHACVNGEWFYQDDRTDPVAIAILEELGSEACSGYAAKLEIEEYDETKYAARIDEHDGKESLSLILLLTPDMIRACKSTDEIIDLLAKINAFVMPERDCFTKEENDNTETYTTRLM